MSKKTEAADPRFHYEIWKGPSPDFGADPKSIYYVENHNGQCGYAELALDFSFAADLAIAECRKTQLGNWAAPIAHLSRQVVELHLKALMETIGWRDSAFDTKPLSGHHLLAIWEPSRDWLVEHGYRLQEDSRLEEAERLISALHAVDPSGDLFRFGISRRTAFGKQKSSDRVGMNLDLFEVELKALRGLLGHWEATVLREGLTAEMGWDKDPYFDADEFPRKPTSD